MFRVEFTMLRTLGLVALLLVAKYPRGQSVHWRWPVTPWNLPGVHLTQALPVCARPTGHSSHAVPLLTATCFDC